MSAAAWAFCGGGGEALLRGWRRDGLMLGRGGEGRGGMDREELRGLEGWGLVDGGRRDG